MFPSVRLRLLSCTGDAVDCCTEEQSGNHVEYQIPNVHPAALTHVTEAGNETITLFNGSSILAEAYQWKFSLAKYTAHTVGSELLRWTVHIEGSNITNDYVNYTAIPDADRAAFQATFAVPPQCQGPHVYSCNGQVSEKSLRFLRAGRFVPMPRLVESPQDTCTGPHESCCPAPLDDPNNCPASARTSDCDAKKSCCCA